MQRPSFSYPHWKDVIPIYLELINSCGGHFVISEGKSDESLYLPIINSYKDIDISLDKKYFLYDFTTKFPLDNISRTFNHANNAINKEKYNFVIEIINCYNEGLSEGKYTNIYCFGIIDRDFGHEAYEKIKNIADNISCTEMHDSECNTIRVYLKDIFPEELFVSNKKKLTSIIKFAYLQGLLEKTATKYWDILNRDIKKVVKYNFKDELINIYSETFDYSRYLDKNKQYVNDTGSYDLIVQEFREELVRNEKIIKNLDSLCLNWIMNNSNKEEIDELFTVINGHVIVTLFNTQFPRNFDLLEKLKNIAIKKPNDIFRIEPLKKYKDYRIKYNLYM